MKLKVVKSGIVACCIAALVTSGSAPAFAKAKQLSDKSVRVLMLYAWTLVPGKFTTPTGTVIITDKTKPKKAMVPMDTAREAIRVGRLTAHAQICGLDEEQVANYQTFMRLQRAKKKWTPQQLLFINQLHLFTVMWLSGNAKLVATGDDKTPKVEPSKKPAQKTCNKDQRKKVFDTIVKYLKANPPPKKSNAALPVNSGLQKTADGKKKN